MLINELKDFSKDVPEKKIILDQLGPDDVSRLVMQIAAYAAIDNARLRMPEDQEVSEDDIDEFIQNVVDDLNRLSTKTNMKKALKLAQEGKV
jgi:hypothetical protein